MVKLPKKTKKAIAVVLMSGMVVGTISTPVFAVSEGWKKNATGWWYQNADGSYLKNQWEKMNDT